MNSFFGNVNVSFSYLECHGLWITHYVTRPASVTVRGGADVSGDVESPVQVVFPRDPPEC